MCPIPGITLYSDIIPAEYVYHSCNLEKEIENVIQPSCVVPIAARYFNSLFILKRGGRYRYVHEVKRGLI